MIAAFGDLDVGEVARRGQHARRQVVIEVRRERLRAGVFNAFAERDDPLQFVGADHGVHFGHVLPDIAAIALDQAAGDDQPLARGRSSCTRPFRGWCRSIPSWPDR